MAAYNVENYLEISNGARPAKSAEAKAKVRETIRGLLDPWRGKNDPPASEESTVQGVSPESKR